MIRLRQVRKNFGTAFSLNIPYLNIPNGLTLVSGGAGAGKTVLLELLATLTPLDSGTMKLDEYDYKDHVTKVRSRIGYVPAQATLYEEMKAGTFLQYMGGLKGVTEASVFQELYRLFELDDIIQHSINSLSVGIQRRLQIAQAFIGAPPVIIMDNPLLGIDAFESRRLQSLFAVYARTRSIIMSCPNMEDMESDTSLLLNNGRLFLG